VEYLSFLPVPDSVHVLDPPGRGPHHL